MRIITAGSAVLVALAVVACGGSAAQTKVRDTSSSGGASLAGTGATQPATTVTRTATAVVSGTGSPPATPTSSGAGGPPTGSSGGASPCVASRLALSFLGQQGATGHGELGFALRNTGGAGCSTIGYPGVQFLDRAGAALPTTPTHTTSDFFGHTSLHPLTLAPGQSASFRLGVTHGAGSSTGCTTTYAVQVIAPNDTATLKVAIPGGASECATATVSPLVAGGAAYP
jgi:hypothetical protein